jgi:hypothetical protein
MHVNFHNYLIINLPPASPDQTCSAAHMRWHAGLQSRLLAEHPTSVAYSVSNLVIQEKKNSSNSSPPNREQSRLHQHDKFTVAFATIIA